jgi:HSP20 family protein
MEDGVLIPALTDVVDMGKSYKCLVDLPAVSKDDLEIKIRGNTLEIIGETSTENRQTNGYLLKKERTKNGYHRILTFPESITGSNVKARFENGVLEVEIPKEFSAESLVRIE